MDRYYVTPTGKSLGQGGLQLVGVLLVVARAPPPVYETQGARTVSPKSEFDYKLHRPTLWPYPVVHGTLFHKIQHPG